METERIKVRYKIYDEHLTIFFQTEEPLEICKVENTFIDLDKAYCQGYQIYLDSWEGGIKIISYRGNCPRLKNISLQWKKYFQLFKRGNIRKEELMALYIKNEE